MISRNHYKLPGIENDVVILIQEGLIFCELLTFFSKAEHILLKRRPIL